MEAIDADGQTAFTFALVSDEGIINGSIAVSPEGVVTYTPDADFNGQESFSYSVTDVDGHSSTQTAVITVAPTNDAPIALDQAAAGAEDTPITAALAVSDIDLDDLSFALVAGGAPNNGSLVFSPDGSFTYTPDENFNGDDEFTYQVDDGAGGQDVATVSLTVTAVNDAPTAPAALATGEEDGVITGRLQATDPEGGAVTFRLAPGGGPKNGSFDLTAAGAFTFVPAANFNGADQATIIVADP